MASRFSYIKILVIITLAMQFSVKNIYAKEIEFSVNKSEKNSPPRLKELYKITEKTKYDKDDQGVKQIRLRTLKQAAFSWGVQEGLYWRYQKIIELMEAQSVELHTVFSFNKFIVNGKMLLPSIVKAERIYEQTSDTTARTVNVSFTLDKPARLIPQPPTWRDYLLRPVDEPQKPHNAIFPRNSAEQVVWIDNLDRGWREGIDQADGIFEIDLRQMKKDIEGMYRFRKLLVMGIVSLPRISSSKYSLIKLDNGKTMNLNDVVYTITAQSDFTDIDKWEPFFRHSGNEGSN